MTKFSKPTDRKRNPIEAYVGALQDAQTYIAKDNAADAERLAALEKQVKEIQTKLADVVTKEEFDSLAKEAVDTYVQSADLLKDYAKKTDLPDLAEYVTKEEIADFITEKALKPYAKKDEVVTIDKLDAKADKTELDKYIPINNDKDGNKSYMANEKDGGIIKYIKPDESYAKVTLCNVDEEAVAQIVATNKDKTTFAKIDARKDGICYSKKTGNPNLAEDEIVVKKDLKVYTPAEMEGLNPGDTAVCHNAKDGGSIKYMTETHTAFVGVDNGGDELFAEFALAENKQGKEFKKGNRLLAKKDGIFYTKDANSTTTAPEDELVVKKDIANLATQDALVTKADKDELKKYPEKEITGENGKALIFNEADGGGAKFEAADGIESFVGVNDGKEIEGLYAQIYCDKPIDGGKWQGAKLDITNEGIYYTVGSDDWATRKKDENKLATVKLINELETKIQTLQEKVNELEGKLNG